MANYAPDIGDLPISSIGLRPTAAHSLPEIPGLRGAYFMGAGERLALTNLVDRGSVPVKVGNPGWENGYAVLSRVNHIDTGISETAAMTMIVASRRPTANNVGYIGNYINDDLRGVGIYSLGSQQTVIGMADRGSVGALSVSVAAVTASWGLYSASIPASGAMTMRNHTSGDETVGSQTIPRVVETAGNILIGCLNTNTFGTTVHIAAALVFNRVLSTSELASAVAWVREAADFSNISV